MSVDKTCRYSKEHEWAKQDQGAFKVGISHYAQEALGDVVFAQLPKVGDAVTAGKSFASVESVKAVSDVYAPVSGKIKAINSALEKTPELINQAAQGDGWFAVIEPAGSAAAEFEALMDAGAYEKFLAEISK